MRIIAVLAFCLCLSGCATIGRNITDCQVASIVDGQTSSSDVLRVMGAPFDKSISEQGLEKWTYIHSVIAGRLTEGQVLKGQKLEILFDDNGIVKKHIFLSDTKQRPQV